MLYTFGIVIIACHYHVIRTQFASVQIQTVSLWDTKSTMQMCHEEHLQDGSVNFQGDPYHGCNLQVLAPSNTFLVIEMPTERGDSGVFFYVERMDNFKDCPKKYVLIEGERKGCSVAFIGIHLTLVLYGNVNVSVRGITPREELQRECPELTVNAYSGVQLNNSCQSVQGYNQLITCYNQDEYHSGVCKITFPSSCSAFLGKKEVHFECRGRETQNSPKLLVVIPPSTSVLHLVDIGIVEIDAYAFQYLPNLRVLHLYYNHLVELPNFLFKGSTQLTHLFLSDNELHTLHPRVFEGLQNLEWLDLFNNQLALLPVDIFEGLESLLRLDLSGNKLGSQGNGLGATLFQKLKKLQILYLHSNGLRDVPDDLFKGLGHLIQLTISLNKFSSLKAGLFRDLNQLIFMNLRGNALTELSKETFQGLNQIQYMPIYDNNLKSLSTDVFQDLRQIKQLDFGNNQLTDVTEVFHGVGSLEVLSLYNNSIHSLGSNVFQDLINLKYLNINLNLLSFLPTDLFYPLRSIQKLTCTRNPLNTIHVDMFKGSRFPNLVILNLCCNRFSNVPRKLFKDILKLDQLYLDGNRIQGLDYDIFYDLFNLTFLSLGHNELEDLDERLFKDLANLIQLALYNNKLRSLKSGIFDDLENMERLSLMHNQLSNLDSNIFKNTVKLIYLEIYNNSLTQLPNFNELTQLTFINIRFNLLINLDTNSFAGLPENVEILASQQEICLCYAPKDTICSASDNRSPYLTCDRLLSDRVLVALMWVIGINALGGNIFVIVWRRKSPQKNKVQDALLTNLALSDLLMGFYMLIIASADIYFGQHFPMQSETWRSGITCKVAGAISIISSEASVFFVTLISLDRFICIRFPFSIYKLTKGSVTVTAIILWTCSSALGIIPSSLSGRYFKFYDNSHVCIGLPLALVERFKTTELFERVGYDETEYDGYYNDKFTFNTTSIGITPGLFFSSAVFLGLNCLCYFVIFGCYVEIIRSVLRSSKEAKLNKEMKDQVRMTAKVAAIVATDFCCWFPIIILGVLVQARVLTLPPSVFAWSVTFVLPINSAINPYLYTISAIISDRKQKNMKKQTGAVPVTASVKVTENTNTNI